MIVSQKDRVIIDNVSYNFDGYTFTNPIKILIEDHTCLISYKDYLIYGTIKSSRIRVFEYICKQYLVYRKMILQKTFGRGE